MTPPAKPSDEVMIDVQAMERLLQAVYEHAGCSPSEATQISRNLIGANLRGHDSHGVIRTARYIQNLRDGIVFANRDAVVEKENDVLAIIDGRFGFGQTVGPQTVDIGVAKAKQKGVAVTALKHAGHLGRIGEWAEQAAASNVASIHMVNARGSLLVAPFGGIDRRAGTSPFCAGFPETDGEPVILDFATSLVAEGKALVALRGGTPLPDGAIITPEGEPTSDPSPLYGELDDNQVPSPYSGPGALCSFGLHKGSGLNFFMEMMGGALTGSGTAGALGDDKRRAVCNGMLSVYLAVEFFHEDDWLAREVRAYIEFVKSSRPTETGGEVLIPGEKERRIMAERTVSGLPISGQAWSDILAAARSVGLGDDEIQALL
tara:strand:+ start:1539 stop:2663 length:1125 start_codon:yes stop_codon:yes gene_type:complete